jgi:polar amino acid transport system permease protein
MDWGVAFRYWPLLAQGLLLTMQITVLVTVLGLLLGIFVAAGRLSRSRLINKPIAGYIELFRGTPALIQLYWFYYCLPIFLGVDLPGLTAVIIALTLNTAAFYGEALRSGIQALPRDQTEAADILGLSYFQKMRHVVVPQAFRIVVPVLLGLTISLFKDTSLVSALGVGDLMYQSRVVSTETYRPIEVFTAAALVYFAVATPFSALTRRLEIRLARVNR